MTRVHECSDSNEESFDLTGDIEVLHHIDDSGVEKHLEQMGITEDIISAVMDAAQKVLDDKGLKSHVAEISIESYPNEMNNKCRCGDRCVARVSEPYTRCRTERDGSRTCVSGYRRRCTRRACNPC